VEDCVTAGKEGVMFLRWKSNDLAVYEEDAVKEKDAQLIWRRLEEFQLLQGLEAMDDPRTSAEIQKTGRGYSEGRDCG
jgi:hypothetical protein